MELWGPPQHNTVRECGYGPLETEKSSFGTTSESPDKKFFFFQGYGNGSGNLRPQFQKSADIFRLAYEDGYLRVGLHVGS